jgi:leader peptidase (prepilin peptidase)/N-methyltransferase
MEQIEQIRNYETLFATFAGVLGAIVGSFLNVVIHRLPRDMSVNNPRRSFCPSCQKQLPWLHNIPVLSWLVLRGRCGFCKTPISPRYLGVEILTALLFLAVWFIGDWNLPLIAALWTFCAITVAATFIDLEHMIIPDVLTYGGAIVGIIFSIIAPALHETTLRVEALGFSLAGAIGGYLLLWGVVELGKLAFGRVKLTADPAEDFELHVDEGKATLKVGDETLQLEEIFSRHSDRIIMTCPTAKLNGQTLSNCLLRLGWDRLETPGQSFNLSDLKEFSGKTSALVIPREAMGFGDVKFMAAIGAFLGWKAVLFSLTMGSVVGAIIGGGALLFKKKEAGAAIPFGPFLAIGALGWVFFGPKLIDWYMAFLRPPVNLY